MALMLLGHIPVGVPRAVYGFGVWSFGMDIVNASHSLVRSYFVTDLILISINTYLNILS